MSIKRQVKLEKPLSNESQSPVVDLVKVVDTYHSIKVETPNIHSPVEAPIRNGIDFDAPPCCVSMW